MNIILFSMFVFGIICLMAGYYSDKISKQSTTKIKWTPAYSEPNKSNSETNLHDYYSKIFGESNTWTRYPHAVSEKLDFPKMKTMSPTDFVNWTWPNLPTDTRGAPVGDTTKPTDCSKCTRAPGKNRNDCLSLCEPNGLF